MVGGSGKESANIRMNGKLIKVRAVYFGSPITLNNIRVTEQFEKIGLKSPFDNVWHYTHGIGFLYENNIDTNLRAVESIIRPNSTSKNHTIWMRPKADGINDFDMLNYNDWELFSKSLCRNVVNPNNVVTNPIQCL